MSGAGSITPGMEKLQCVLDGKADVAQAILVLKDARQNDVMPSGCIHELSDAIDTYLGKPLIKTTSALEVHAESSRITPIGQNDGGVYGHDTYCNKGRSELVPAYHCSPQG